MAITAGASSGHYCILAPLGFSTRGRLFEMKMDKQRWQQIETLYHAALEREPDERAAYLADACADDSGLLREVEDFLRYDPTDGSFRQHNALAVAAQADEPNELSQTNPQLFPGQGIGAYKILALLGHGGMGVVYRARDEQLRREVAIKVLHASLAHDADRLRRFEQEAHATSSQDVTLGHGSLKVYGDRSRPLIALPFLSLTAGDLTGLLCFKPRSIPK